MAKYHINSKGNPAVCRATKGKCPFGGADQHFESRKDVIAEAERRHEQEATPTGNTGFSVDKLEINWGKNVTSKNREEAENGYTETLIKTLPSGETCEYTHKRIEREDSPAVVDKVKDSDGLFHCDGVFPASISRIKNPDGTLKLDIAKWYKHGQLHRDGDLPALDSKADNLSGTQEWWKNGEMHRDGDKPAKSSSKKTGVWKSGMNTGRCVVAGTNPLRFGKMILER